MCTCSCSDGEEERAFTRLRHDDDDWRIATASIDSEDVIESSHGDHESGKYRSAVGHSSTQSTAFAIDSGFVDTNAENAFDDFGLFAARRVNSDPEVGHVHMGRGIVEDFENV